MTVALTTPDPESSNSECEVGEELIVEDMTSKFRVIFTNSRLGQVVGRKH